MRLSLQDWIAFVLTNGMEMNKGSVSSSQGHSRDREKREMECRKLRILVGTNLVRFSQLDGVDLGMYQKSILPAVLEQVVNCKDVIAQEYLMEVVIQVGIPVHTVLKLINDSCRPPFNRTVFIRNRHPKINIKLTVIALVDRLMAYGASEAESEQELRLERTTRHGPAA